MTGVNESVYIVKHFTTRTCSDVPFLCSTCDCFHNDTHGYVVYTCVRIYPYRDFYSGERSFVFVFEIGAKKFFKNF